MNQIKSLIKHDNDTQVSNSTFDRVKIAQSLFGILPQDADIDDSKEKRLADK